jgi:membrane protein
VAGDRKKGAKKRRGVVEAVLVPLVSTALVTTAVIHSLHDHPAGPHAPTNEDPADEDPGDGDADKHSPDNEGLVRKPPPGRWREPDRPSPLDRIATRLPFLRPVAAVQRRYGDVGGNQLAAALTLRAFLSIFPLLLVAIAVLGFMAAGSHTDVAGRLVSQLGLRGQAARTLTDAVGAAERSRKKASLVGFVGLLWTGLGLVGALQCAYNAVWQVRDRGLPDRVVGVLWLFGAAILFIGGAVATATLRWMPGVLAPAGVLVTLAVSFGLWLWTSRVLPNLTVPWRSLLPGAVLGAVGLEVLKAVGAYYVPRAVASSSQLYGSLGIIFAILAWLLLFGRLVVYSAVLNVVLFEKHDGTVQAVVEAPPVPGARPLANRSGRLVTVEDG